MQVVLLGSENASCWGVDALSVNGHGVCIQQSKLFIFITDIILRALEAGMERVGAVAVIACKDIIVCVCSDLERVRAGRTRASSFRSRLESWKKAIPHQKNILSFPPIITYFLPAGDGVRLPVWSRAPGGCVSRIEASQLEDLADNVFEQEAGEFVET
jgi:hypothetical protein